MLDDNGDGIYTTTIGVLSDDTIEYKFVNGTVRLQLWHGNAIVNGVKSTESLYDPKLATYSEDDEFDQSIAKGFIAIWGQPLKTQAKAQKHVDDKNINDIS